MRKPLVAKPVENLSLCGIGLTPRSPLCAVGRLTTAVGAQQVWRPFRKAAAWVVRRQDPDGNCLFRSCSDQMYGSRARMSGSWVLGVCGLPSPQLEHPHLHRARPRPPACARADTHTHTARTYAHTRNRTARAANAASAARAAHRARAAYAHPRSTRSTRIMRSMHTTAHQAQHGAAPAHMHSTRSSRSTRSMRTPAQHAHTCATPAPHPRSTRSTHTLTTHNYPQHAHPQHPQHPPPQHIPPHLAQAPRTAARLCALLRVSLWSRWAPCAVPGRHARERACGALRDSLQRGGRSATSSSAAAGRSTLLPAILSRTARALLAHVLASGSGTRHRPAGHPKARAPATDQPGTRSPQHPQQPQHPQHPHHTHGAASPAPEARSARLPMGRATDAIRCWAGGGVGASGRSGARARSRPGWHVARGRAAHAHAGGWGARARARRRSRARADARAGALAGGPARGAGDRARARAARVAPPLWSAIAAARS